jgi:hypothetical protein
MVKGLSEIVTWHARPPPHVPWEAASQRPWENPPFLDHVGQPTDLRDAPERRDQILHGCLSPTLAVCTHGKGTYSASYRCFDLNTIVPYPSRTHLSEAERGAHLRGGRQAEGLMAAVAGEAAWFGGAKRAAEPGCERRVRATEGTSPYGFTEATSSVLKSAGMTTSSISTSSLYPNSLWRMDGG